MKYLGSALCFSALLVSTRITFGQTPTSSSPSPGSKARGSGTPSGSASPGATFSQKGFEEAVQGLKERVGAASETVMVRITEQGENVRNRFAYFDKPECLGPNRFSMEEEIDAM